MRAIMGNSLLAIVAIYCAFFGSMIDAKSINFNNDENVPLPTDRLPPYVRPTRYDINLNFEGVMDSPSKTPYYSGTVNIDVEFNGPHVAQTTPMRHYNLNKLTNKLTNKLKMCVGKKPKEQVQADTCPMFKPNRIVMHADKDVIIQDVEVITKDARGNVNMANIVKTGRDASKQLISFELDQNLPEGRLPGQIKINFKAPVRNDVHGVYMSGTNRKDHLYRHIVAKFQPTFARLALPCFDEPGFKAEFDFTITYDISTPGRPMDAYATMDGKKSTIGKTHVTQFERTPPMSIHMVAFIVGSFNNPPAIRQIRPDLQFRFLGVPDHLAEGEFALDVAEKTLAWFENYIGYKFPLKKLDIVAIGETDQDNTETWGLVFVRENILEIGDESQLTSRIAAAVNVAHIVVHQWFANLVTAKWWDDLWLTENVAAEMAYQVVDELFPDYQTEYFVRIGTLSSMLTRDRTGLVHTISPPEEKLTTSAQIYEFFDVLAFMKSGAVARMMQHTVGFDHFQQALRLIVQKFNHKNFDFEDFIGCIKETAKPDQDMAAIVQMLRSFSKLSGFPLINVDLATSGKSLIAYLEPFHKAESKVDVSKPVIQQGEYIWRTPLNVLVFDSSGLKRATVQFVWNKDTTATAELPDWFNHDEHFLKIQPNPDFSTYYRIRYSDALLNKLQTPIEEKKLSPMDRLHILDDANALVGSKLIANDQFRDLFDWHQNEDNPAVIIEMLVAAQTLAKLPLTQGKYTGQSPSNKVFQTIFDEYGFGSADEKSTLVQRARSAALKALVAQGVEQVIQEAVATFARGDVAPFLREAVYLAVVEDNNEGRLNKLADHLFETDSPEEKIRLASALVYTDNKSILQRLVNSLNEPYNFKTPQLAQIVALTPKLDFDENGKVKIVQKK